MKREPTLKAQTHNSGFPLGHDTYNGLSAASDGRIYYVLSTEAIRCRGADVRLRSGHREDPRPGRTDRGLRRAGPQDHRPGEEPRRFVESKGKLYFATHVGYYSIENGMETMGVPPEGYQPYPGGHLLAYDMATGKFDDLAIAPSARESCR